jgi:hypothetical protein
MTAKIEIFLSYAHEDETLRKELEKQLIIFQRQGLIDVWHDRMISAGKEWDCEVDVRLNQSHIILLLVSSDFMASDYCYSVEVKRAMEKHEAGEARVIPIILRPVYWQGALFGRLQALPKDGKSVISWQNSDEAFFEVAEGIRKAVEELITKPLPSFPMPKQTHDILEKVLDTDLLYHALLSLNYQEQVRIFRQFFLQKYRIGTFLIHGELEYGQQWLLNRLVKQVPGNSVAKVFKADFQRRIRGRSLDALWRELAAWLGLKNTHSPQDILKQVHRLWQIQTVILILHHVDMIDEEYMNKFIEDFWLPLSKIACSTPSQSGNNYLLMFLVDSDACVDKWSIAFAKQLDSDWEPYIPIKLKKLTQFTEDVLTRWIEHEVDALPPTLIVRDILKETDGIPQIVFERICELCGRDWYERENVWIKY